MRIHPSRRVGFVLGGGFSWASGRGFLSSLLAIMMYFGVGWIRFGCALDITWLFFSTGLVGTLWVLWVYVFTYLMLSIQTSLLKKSYSEFLKKNYACLIKANTQWDALIIRVLQLWYQSFGWEYQSLLAGKDPGFLPCGGNIYI